MSTEIKLDRSEKPSGPEWLRRLEHLRSGQQQYDLRSEVIGLTHSRQRVEVIYRESKVSGSLDTCLTLLDGIAIQQVIKPPLFRELFPGNKKVFLLGTKGEWKYLGSYTLYVPYMMMKSGGHIVVRWYCLDNFWQPNDFLDLRFRKS